MRITALVLLMMLSCIPRANRPDLVSAKAQQQSNSPSNSIGEQSSQIKISIATGGVPYQPAKDTYRVGERVPVVITMTNTGSEPVSVCETGALYQDRPQLLKDGKPVPYISFQQSSIQMMEKDKTCNEDNLPQQIMLRPNEPTVVDWFILSKGASSINDVAWYEPLQPGKYTFTDQRRLNCCDGPLIKTNTIEFVVAP
ncbi:MAG: hypothetical protein QOE96_3552 [Blastocatellia bacterium]|nr:hypothetical protein [Blastocatellia bacterium]